MRKAKRKRRLTAYEGDNRRHRGERWTVNTAVLAQQMKEQTDWLRERLRRAERERAK